MPVHVHKASGSAGLAQGQLPPARALSLTGSKLNRLNSVVGEYAGACVQVARDCGIDVLDLWTLMQEDTQVGPGSVLGVSRIPQTGPCSCRFQIKPESWEGGGEPPAQPGSSAAPNSWHPSPGPLQQSGVGTE